MEGSKEQYQEIVHAAFDREIFENLCLSNGLIAEKDYKIKNIDVKDYPYNKHEIWVKQKAISLKAYKKLKDIEYELRNDSKLNK